MFWQKHVSLQAQIIIMNFIISSIFDTIKSVVEYRENIDRLILGLL